MKRTSLLIIPAIYLSISCNNGAPSTNPTVDTSDKVTTATVVVPLMVQCYENLKGPDTLRLQLTDSSGIVTGKLDYKIDDKDENTGTFSGNMFGDTLIANYTFRSEGVTSTRQIAFLRKDSFLVEGFGPVSRVKKQTKFKSRDSLVFNQVNRLILVPCK